MTLILINIFYSLPPKFNPSLIFEIDYDIC